MKKDILNQNGINYDAGVHRLMGDSAMYEEMLAEFLKDDCYNNINSAYDAKDYKALFEQTYALKGVAGSLDMTMLFKAVGELTESVRNYNDPDKDKLPAQMEAVRAAYKQVVQGIIDASK